MQYHHITNKRPKDDDDDKYKKKRYDRVDYVEDDDCASLVDCCLSKKCGCVLLTIIMIIIIIFVFHERAEEATCHGDKCVAKTCEAMKNNLCSGGLCMELCIDETIDLDACQMSPISSTSIYRFFLIDDTNDMMIWCNSDTLNKAQSSFELYKHPSNEIPLVEFVDKIMELFEKKISYKPKVEEITTYLLDFIDVNRDGELNLQEAKTLWTMLSNNHTFYMLAFHGRPYVPRIKRFCGAHVFEIEHLLHSYLYSVERDSVLPSFFPRSYKWSWPEWRYRVKIVIGILDFLSDLDAFNPNDVLGSERLYLCSPIHTSFGYTFVYEAKLIDYSQLVSANELQEILSNRYCNYDSDCVYTASCIAKCDTKTHKCSSELAEPQIVNLCRLIKFYLLDSNSQNQTSDSEEMKQLVGDDRLFDRVLRRCFRLSNITLSTYATYANYIARLSKTDSYISANPYAKHDYTPVENDGWWTNSMEYSTLVNDLRHVLWYIVKDVKEPKRPQKKKQNAQLTSTPATQDKKANK